MTTAMAYIWWVTGGGLLGLFCLATVSNAQCVVPTASETYYTNDLEDMTDRICNRCYQAPHTQQLEVKLLKIRLLGLSSIMLYIDGTQHHITQDCGFCDPPGNQNMSESGSEATCRECEMLPSGSVVELYLRLESITHFPGESNACQKIAEFNISMTFTEKSDCEDGFMVSFPAGGDSCVVNTTSTSLETVCIIPTCSEGIISPDELTEKVEHMFHPLSPSQSCVWQLNTGGRKHLTLRFSQGIRPHLTVFEESLTNPKWDMEWCPAYSDVFRRDTDAETVFVVYRNPSKLAKRGSLSITTQSDLCLLPPTLEDGSVKFQRQGSGTVALYTCNVGYTLLGPSQLNCTHGTWDEPPSCIPDKGKLMSDAPVEGEEGVNVTVVAPEVGTNTTPADAIDGDKMPVAEDDELAEDAKEITKEESVEMDKAVVEKIKVEENEVLERKPIEEGKIWEQVPHLNNSLEDWDVEADLNFTMNGTGTDQEDSSGLLQQLLKTLDLEEDMAIYVIGGGAGVLLLLVIILAIAVAMCRKSYSSGGFGQHFDTFQNPIYEKTVVTMQPEGDGEVGHGGEEEEEEEEDRKKSDGEEMSDCTVLE
ncbi:hypothetical protein Pcinc_020991 [Petrolisthes cinctipes]|uniref:Sushi domain-containing protein n=1 Tax=Petrolisthes cinctipes TaxID=88211 RepID=A0AAE1FIK8_PETCI|nr:hypothetical protein Pcinc_020991 [Petrolisthes cinctipes]